MPNSAGRIASILRVPIKSFQGESIQSTELQEHGILGDRPLALVEKETGKVVSARHAKLNNWPVKSRTGSRKSSSPVWQIYIVV